MKIIRISSIWCSSCIVTHKDFKKLQENYKDFEYIEYDYDEDTEMVEKYQIGKIIPVIIIVDENDHEITRIIGEKKYSEIEEIIKDVVYENRK